MKFAPLITYDTPSVFLPLTLSQKWWEPEEGVGFGDEDETDAGMPHSYVVRYDQRVGATLRFTDDERVAVMQFIEWAMKNRETSFLFRFDQNDAGTEFEVYLETPAPGEMVRPTRGTAFWTWELPVMLRSVAGERFNVPGVELT